jgi:hypothetical protein
MAENDANALPETGGENARENRGGNGTSKPKPETLPEPTYWPAVLAVGVTLLAWGVVTSTLLSLLGLGISIVAVIKWIGDIRHEQGFGRSEQ